MAIKTAADAVSAQADRHSRMSEVPELTKMPHHCFVPQASGESKWAWHRGDTTLNMQQLACTALLQCCCHGALLGPCLILLLPLLQADLQ